jgi:hypothetical protein
MEVIKQRIKELLDRARTSRKTETETMTSNGRECTIEAKAVGFWILKKPEIAIKYNPLENRKCAVVSKFVYDQGRDIDRKIRVASLVETLKGFASRTVATADMSQINKTLVDMKSFVQQNDLLPEEIKTLGQPLRDLCSKPIIRWGKDFFSINEIDCDPHCLEIAFKAEAIEILLDAKESGQVELEKNVPPKIVTLGSGEFNTVKLAHTGKEGHGPVALKPCDQSKKEANAKGFAQTTLETQKMIGRASGNYGRNKATAKLQDVLANIGQRVGITVPRVVATVSAATMEGIPCVAMEALEGGIIGKAANDGKIEYNNEFVRRETWMQLQDILTGQIDRHGGNVILTKDGPVAIDHDLSFPTDPPRDCAAIVPFDIAVDHVIDDKPYELAVDGVSPRNYCMPPVIDWEMYKVIMAINLTELKNMYEECGLTRFEIKAAISRAEALKEAAQQLPKRRVIDPNRWAVVSTKKKGPCNDCNFYAARHFYGG